MSCTEKCWTATICPAHGDQMNPLGRSAGMESYVCCENYMDHTINPRHLWHEHDSTRHYFDPVGWAAHEANCDVCNPKDEDEL